MDLYLLIYSRVPRATFHLGRFCSLLYRDLFLAGGESIHINGATIFFATLPRTLALITLQLSGTIVGNLSLLAKQILHVRAIPVTPSPRVISGVTIYIPRNSIDLLKVGHGTFLRQVRSLSLRTFPEAAIIFSAGN